MASEAEIRALQHVVEGIQARLDRIEDHLVRTAQMSGIPFATAASTIPPEVVELVKAGKRVDAVAKYRELTHASMDDARQAINEI